jgi:sulfite dehydrogenase (cytochrome) subunit A
MLDRRNLIKRAGAGIFALGSGLRLESLNALALDTVTLPFENGERPLVNYPQKRPMIGLTSRPPQLETPFSVFNEGTLTPNDAFFVRYHLSVLPLSVDPDTFFVEINGKVDKPMKLSLQEIKRLDAVELVAVNQCSGNSRGFFNASPAGSWAMVRWAMHAGRACRLKSFSTKSASNRAPVRSLSMVSMDLSATRHRTL